jgi:hypothetical protein
MKTAMQKLISTFNLYQNSASTQEEQELLSFYIKCAEDLIETEKEQMFYWFYGGGGLSATDDFRKEFENNYNQTYNQNK